MGILGIVAGGTALFVLFVAVNEYLTRDDEPGSRPWSPPWDY